MLETNVFLVMSESQKFQNFLAVDGGGEELAPLTLTFSLHSHKLTPDQSKTCSLSLIWSNLKTDLTSVIQHDISDFSLL